MEAIRPIPNQIKYQESFSRKEFMCAMESEYALTYQEIAYDLQKRLDNGSLIHVGWGKYAQPAKLKLYQHQYSDFANEVADKILTSFSELNFQIFELTALNGFMNHQIAHNTVFVSVENALMEYVFDMLHKVYPGRVLLKPNLGLYFRYLQDNEIVVIRLPSGSPKGLNQPWMSRLEKILVDILTDKLISVIVPDGEKENILTESVHNYYLDKGAMLRYAKRKGAEKKLTQMLAAYGKADIL